jgi:RNase H-fold protein (predicted Holliday junction resolvase)
MQRGILPKDATLPGVNKMEYDEEKIKQQAKLRIDKKAQSYSNPLVIFCDNL